MNTKYIKVSRTSQGCDNTKFKRPSRVPNTLHEAKERFPHWGRMMEETDTQVALLVQSLREVTAILGDLNNEVGPRTAADIVLVTAHDLLAQAQEVLDHG